MTPADAAIILGTAAAFDRRTVGKADAMAWSDVLDNTPLDDAIQAVKNHYAMSRDFIYPADVLAGVKSIERTRIDAGPNLAELEPPERIAILDGEDFDNAYRQWLQESGRRIRRGLPVEHGPSREGVPLDEARIRSITEALARDKGAKNEPRESA